RTSPSCAHDDDRLRFPSVSPAQNSKAGKKESMGRHLSQPCPLCARPSSNSFDHRRSDVPTAKNGFATRYSVNKSAKVVLGRALINHPASPLSGKTDIEPTSPHDGVCPKETCGVLDCCCAI